MDLTITSDRFGSKRLARQKPQTSSFSIDSMDVTTSKTVHCIILSSARITHSIEFHADVFIIVDSSSPILFTRVCCKTLTYLGVGVYSMKKFDITFKKWGTV